MLNVHCNKDEFDALVASDPGRWKTVERSHEGRGIVGKIVTNPYVVGNTDSPPALPAKPLNGLDLGDRFNPDGVKAKTGRAEFYNKECAFVCVDTPNGGGASLANGADKNVTAQGSPLGRNVEPARPGDRYGVVSGTTNAAQLTFFRDNEWKRIDTNVWYPASDGVVTYSPSQFALTTTVTRWADGTPSTLGMVSASEHTKMRVPGSKAGRFEARAVNESGVKTELFTGKEPVKNQRNWDVSTMNSPNSVILTGLHRTFEVRASWASEKDRPQSLNIKWEYSPKVRSTMSTQGFGFGAGSAQREGTIGHNEVPIQGKCQLTTSTPVGHDMTQAFQDNTGGGVTNRLDGQIIGHPVTEDTSVPITFVRAVAE